MKYVFKWKGKNIMLQKKIDKELCRNNAIMFFEAAVLVENNLSDGIFLGNAISVYIVNLIFSCELSLKYLCCYFKFEYEKDGQKVTEIIDEPEPIHTFAPWKALGFKVKKGEKSIAQFVILSFIF